MASITSVPATFDEFCALSPKQRGAFFRNPGEDPKGTPRCLIYTQQYTRAMIDHLVTTANHLADPHNAAACSRLLAGRTAALYFTQPSTRTFVSFSLAAQAIGMATEEIRSPERASLTKGETQLDTLLTLAELADCVIVRHDDARQLDHFACECLMRGMPVRIINAGSGSDQHPTQALLEIATLVSRGNLTDEARPFTVGIVGDLRRARAARSFAYLLALYPQVRQVFIAPDDLQMGDDLCRYLREQNVDFRKTDDLDGSLAALDAVYVMRMQDEYGETSEALRTRYGQYRLTTERASRLPPEAIILHPLPRRDELPIELDTDPRAAYWEAVRLGRFLRSALLLMLFGRNDIL